ncbi:unnamed protein product, partial [Ectocarpus sp. 12 AP-2014]
QGRDRTWRSHRIVRCQPLGRMLGVWRRRDFGSPLRRNDGAGKAYGKRKVLRGLGFENRAYGSPRLAHNRLDLPKENRLPRR